jgi:sulfonate transport system substrate-binding protein
VANQYELTMRRRDFLQLCLGTTLIGLSGNAGGQARTGTKELRMGYQKNGVLVIARQQGSLERKLAPRGVDVKWSEFPSGPPMLEAMNAGSIDIGQVGDTPPVFAQAAGAAILYVAGQPSTNGHGILVKRDSPIRTLADLKGRRVGFTQGSAAHNLTLMVLEKANLTYADIAPRYLSPPDGAAAFARDSVDAWAIWDPYFAIGQAHGGRVLVHASEIGKTNSFYIGNRDFVAGDPRLLRDVLDTLAETSKWVEANRHEVAKTLAEVTGVDLDVQTIVANRSSFSVGKLTEEIIATQQAVADRFHRLSLIPRPIVVREAVWGGALA